MFPVELFQWVFQHTEYINGTMRWCIWIKAGDLDATSAIPEIAERIARTREMCLNSRDEGANNLANRPYQFRDTIASSGIVTTCLSKHCQHLVSPVP